MQAVVDQVAHQQQRVCVIEQRLAASDTAGEIEATLRLAAARREQQMAAEQ